MTIVYDIHIPYLAEAVQQHWPDVCLRGLEPSAIDACAVRDADVLVVRTRTRVNEDLLRGSRVRLVCTATIGFDHIDTTYCAAAGIEWMSCPGCNAQAVCDYIEEIIASESRAEGLTIGVVGVGHVGSLVVQMAERRGLTVLVNDPPKGIGVPLEHIAQASDIITFHVPLTKDGQHATYHLCDASFLNQCKPNTLIINASRGGVVDEPALLQSGLPYCLDTWENEPHISVDLLRHARLASMHIAGYSVMGKRNATQMCLDAISRLFDRTPIVLPTSIPASGDSAPGWLHRLTEQMKSQFLDNPQNISDLFESIRKAYLLR